LILELDKRKKITNKQRAAAAARSVSLSIFAKKVFFILKYKYDNKL
jgi:hypothetical protein